MIVGIGIDLVKISRIRQLVQRWARRFLDRVFTEREQQYCYEHRDPSPHLSGRFAVKEAIFKALGAGRAKGIRCNDIEVLNTPQGKPFVTVSGTAKQRLAELEVTEIHVSISHDTDYAVGQVILSKAQGTIGSDP